MLLPSTVIYMRQNYSLFNLSNEYGLTDVVEKNLNPIQAIQKSPLEGLNILSSGPLPSNPSRMLIHLNGRLLNNLSQQFDYILLNTRPLRPWPHRCSRSECRWSTSRCAKITRPTRGCSIHGQVPFNIPG